MVKKSLFLLSIISILCFTTAPMQQELSRKKKLSACSSLIATTIGVISLTDQLVNNKKSWRQSAFTVSSCVVGIASFYNYLSWCNPTVYSYSHNMNLIGVCQRNFSLVSYTHVDVVEHTTHYTIEGKNYNKSKFLSEEYEYSDGIIYNAVGNIIEPNN